MLKLYTSQVCPFAHRTRLALAAKGLVHERIEIDLSATPGWYLELSPTGKVPLLEHDGRLIWESALINEYLEETFPETPLWPADPYLKARGRIAIEVAGSGFIPTFYKILRGDTAEALPEIFKDLEKSMVGEGPFWVGPYVSLTDLAIFPWFERFSVLEHYRSLKRPEGTRLRHWWDAMEKVSAVHQERTDAALYVKGYTRYALSPATK